MFTSKSAMTAREVESARTALLELLRQRDRWYDGTVASVDNRLRAVQNAIPVVHRAASADSEMGDQILRLHAEAKSLLRLRSDLLGAAACETHRDIPRISKVGPATVEARRFVATNLRQFLADNADALSDPDEMDVRAEDHADLATLQLPVTEANSVIAHFRIAVNWAVRNHIAEQQRKPAEPRQRQASVDNFPDDMLFG